jgi:predicted metal-dependent enzyme (double-stranded beta helix superfamily)
MHLNNLPNKRYTTILEHADRLPFDSYHTLIVKHAGYLSHYHDHGMWEYVSSSSNSTVWRDANNHDKTCRVSGHNYATYRIII